MPTDNDPLAEDEGPCTRCDGGWVQVQPAYAVHQYPDLSAEQLDGLPPEAVELLVGSIDLMRYAALNSVYPCRRCRPAMFFRWAGGHFKFGHDIATCPECIEVLGGRRAARRVAAHLPDGPVTTTPRRDTDG